MAQHASTTATLFTDFISDNVRPQTHRDKLHPVVYSQRTDTLSFTTGAATVPTVKQGRSSLPSCPAAAWYAAALLHRFTQGKLRPRHALPPSSLLALTWAQLREWPWSVAARNTTTAPVPAAVPARQAPSVA